MKNHQFHRSLSRNDAIEWGAHATRVLSSPVRRRLPVSDLRSNQSVQRGLPHEVFGGPPNTAGQRPRSPIPTESLRLNHEAYDAA